MLLWLAAREIEARSTAERLGVPYKNNDFIYEITKLYGMRGVCVIELDTAHQRRDYHEIKTRMRVMQAVVFKETDYGRNAMYLAADNNDPIDPSVLAHLAGRRERISSLIRNCPACKSQQLQLISHHMPECEFKCRTCKCEFSVRID